MQHKTDVRFQRALSVRSGCRAGEGVLGQKAICEQGCLTNRDLRTLICTVKGWPKDGMCDQSQAMLDSCLKNCH